MLSKKKEILRRWHDNKETKLKQLESDKAELQKALIERLVAACSYCSRTPTYYSEVCKKCFNYNDIQLLEKQLNKSWEQLKGDL